MPDIASLIGYPSIDVATQVSLRIAFECLDSPLAGVFGSVVITTMSDRDIDEVIMDAEQVMRMEAARTGTDTIAMCGSFFPHVMQILLGEAEGSHPV